MKRNPLDLNELIAAVWPYLNSVQRLALLLQIFAYDVLNRFERFEVRLLTAFAFLFNIAVFTESLPPHPLSKFITYASAFYTAALLLMIATWPPRRKPQVHWVK